MYNNAKYTRQQSFYRRHDEEGPAGKCLMQEGVVWVWLSFIGG